MTLAPAQTHRLSDLLLVALTLDEGHPEDEMDAAQAVLDALVDAGWTANNDTSAVTRPAPDPVVFGRHLSGGES